MDELLQSIRELINTVNLLLQTPKSYDRASMISAWAAVSAVIMSAIISVLTSLHAKKQFKEQLEHDKRERANERSIENKKISVSVVTENRANWIKEFRELASGIMAYDYRFLEDESKLVDANNKLLYAVSKLQLMLNIMGPFDQVISYYLDGACKCRRLSAESTNKHGDFIKNKRCLSICIQIYLKAEWNRIKMESFILQSPDTIGTIHEKKYNENEAIFDSLNRFTSDGSYYELVKEIKELYRKNLESKTINPILPHEYV